MENAVIYARFSSHNQQEQSIDGQLRYCKDYAERNAMKVINVYADRAISGTTDERPQFQQMIRDAKNKQFKYILVWKLDRFARNRYDSAVYKNQLKKCGVRVLSVTEFVGEGSEGVLLESILEAMAETYSLQLSENVRRGMRESVRNGLSCGGTAPLGYDVVNKRYVVNEKEAEIVRYVYNQYATGKGKKEIINDINAKGWRNKKGAKFAFNSLDRLLKNRKYIGEYNYQDITVKDVIPAIVDVNLFETVQNILIKNKRNRGTKSCKHEYLLSTKLFCGYCGASMTGETVTGRNNVKFGYYFCRSQKFRTNNCKKKRERQEELENIVVRKTLEMYSDKKFIEEVAMKVVDLYNSEFGDNHLTTLEENKNSLEAKFDELSHALLKTTNARMLDKLNKEIEQIDIELNELELEIAREKSILQAKMNVSDVIEFIKNVMNGNIRDKEFQKQIINTFVNSIYVFDDKIIIYYNGAKEAEKVSFSDMLKDLNVSSYNGSAQPKPLKVETPRGYLISSAVLKTFALIASR